MGGWTGEWEKGWVNGRIGRGKDGDRRKALRMNGQNDGWVSGG